VLGARVELSRATPRDAEALDAPHWT